jgi:hypothetical protein
MAGLLERSENRRYELERSRHIRRVVIISIICILLVVGIFAYIINGFLNREYSGFDVIHTTPRVDSNTVKYASYNGKILKYSRDGASAMDGAGNILWNGSYELKNPQIDICEDYVAVADIGGKEVYVFDGKDSGTRIETLLPILQVKVANQGMVVVVLEDKDSNIISFYDPYSSSQQIKVEAPTNVQTDGYPVDIDVSEDGLKLVTSFISVESGVVESKLTFYSFDEVGENKPSNIVGAADFDGNIIYKVEFVNKDTVCVYGENSFTIYKKMEQPQEIFTETFKDPIKSILSNENYIGFVLENNGGENKYKILLYDLSGNIILDQPINYDYDQVNIRGKEIIFFSDLECSVLRITGKEKFHYTFDKSISYFMPVDNKEKYIVMDDINIQEIKLTGRKR